MIGGVVSEYLLCQKSNKNLQVKQLLHIEMKTNLAHTAKK